MLPWLFRAGLMPDYRTPEEKKIEWLTDNLKRIRRKYTTWAGGTDSEVKDAFNSIGETARVALATNTENEDGGGDG